MDDTTIKKLNQINNDFYQQVATSFDSSRQYYWDGWNQLLPFFDNQSDIRVLDLACGNGRFGTFLHEHLPETKLSYTGIDQSSELLDFAKQSLQGKIPAVHLKQKNIISELQENNQFLSSEELFHFAGVFGFMHHVPSLKLRIQLIVELLNHLHTGGTLCLSFWQFLSTPRLAKKAQNSPEIFDKFNVEYSQIENNDYILDWKRGSEAYRYCHLVTETELHELITEVQKHVGVELKKTFFADGKEGNINLYCILTKD